MEDIKQILKSNSLVEGITAADISDTDEIVSVIIEQKFIDSIAYQICDIQPLHGPTGGAFALIYDKSNNKPVLKRVNVAVEQDPLSDTGFTLEAVQDLQKQFGKNISDFIGKSFSGINSANENTNLLTKMSTWAVSDGTLTLSTPGNAESNVFEVSQKIAEAVLKINAKTYRTLDAYAILPQSVAASYLALGSYFADDVNESGLFIGKTGRIKYYVNPDETSTEVIVGFNGNTPGNSSVILSPYQHTIKTVIDPDFGDTKLFNVNRYAITLSPLNETGNEVLRKFTIA